MKTSKTPWKIGNKIVVTRGNRAPLYVVAPPGWYRKRDGTGYVREGKIAGCEHSASFSEAYHFTPHGAARIAANCCGKVV